MTDTGKSKPIQPVEADERYQILDVLRGAALLGVLLINLDSGFRGSLFHHILNFHTHPGQANRATDLLLEWIFEFKALTLFSFLFGVGAGIQSERLIKRGRNSGFFLFRRFTVLLIIGLGHMLLIWNGDILTLYAVCGLLMLPFTKLPGKLLVVTGLAVIALSPYLPFFYNYFPDAEAMRAQASLATRIYSSGTPAEIMSLRFNEAVHFIMPLLLATLPRTFGLMLLGTGVWRTGIMQRPQEWRSLFWGILAIAGSLGALTTTLEVWSKETGNPAPGAFDLLYPYSVLFLAFAYAACLLLWLGPRQTDRLEWPWRLMAAAGRMALSNYLAQSVVFTTIFYSYGIGLFGRLGSADALLLGLTVFAAQLIASELWLRQFRFGPAEWLWRSMTYEQWQTMKRSRSVNGQTGDER